jgi:hypothetical protein
MLVTNRFLRSVKPYCCEAHGNYPCFLHSFIVGAILPYWLFVVLIAKLKDKRLMYQRKEQDNV